MPVASSTFDLNATEWRRIADSASKPNPVDFEYSLLGYDLGAKRLDMLLRYGEGGYCRRHRHVASTVTLVLEGEQFLEEMQPGGGMRSIKRTKGAYALAQADALPHDEHGGINGGTVLLSMVAADDGVLFEYFDENMQNPWTVSIKEFVESWETGSAYGLGPSHEDSVASSEIRETLDSEVVAALIDDQPLLRESQEVSSDDRVFDVRDVPVSRAQGGPATRYDLMKEKEAQRNWRVGIGLAAVVCTLLLIAGYFIMGAYDRSLPPSDRNLGDLTRPALR